MKSRKLLCKTPPKSSPAVLSENEHAVLFVKTSADIPVISYQKFKADSCETVLKVEELFNDCDASVGLSHISDAFTYDSNSDSVSVQVHIVNVDIHN